MKNNIFLILIIITLSSISCFSPKKENISESENLNKSLLVTHKHVNFDSLDIPQKDELSTIDIPEDEWKERLSKEEYYILREKGTERSFTGKYWDNKEKGIYVCAGCQLPLFSSETKFKSGTGWPSFYQPIEDYLIDESADHSFGMKRVEVLCARCNGHLGHVFEDGPEPTGLRYCINGNGLDFIKP